MNERLSRRQLLGTLGVGATTLLAGCLASPGSDDTNDAGRSGTSAFFTLQDWGNQVGGDIRSFDTPIEVGSMGHGWDPDADIMPEIAGHEVFFYLGTPEFQWAIDVASELENEDHDIHLIDAMEAISPSQLLPFTGRHNAENFDPDRNIDYDPETLTVGTFELHLGEEVVAWWHDNHWHGGIPDVPHGDDLSFDVLIEDDQGNVLPLGDDEPFQANVRVANDAPDDRFSAEIDGRTITFTGEETGQTLVVFELLSGSDVVFDTSADPTVIRVVPPDEITIDAFHDPHVWVDPVHAQSIVDHLATELSTFDSANADQYREHADAYLERLASVDQQFEELMDDAELDLAVYVAHDAFQYVEARYGFELRTPVGVTPDAAESIEDIATLASLIDEFEIDVILFDPFEAPNPEEDFPQTAQVLLDDTRATEALPLSPAEATTRSWRDEGYGWVEQMEEINLPSLRRALRAD